MLYLHAMGHFFPEQIITNKFLADLDIGTTEEWILERVGVKSRRTVLPLEYIRQTKNSNPLDAFAVRQYKNSEMAAAAAQMALKRARLNFGDIGMLIAGSSAPDGIAPAESSATAARLGMEVPCFDMNSACSSFGMQINFLLRMQPKALPPYILVTDVDSITRTINYADRGAAVLFGDGAAAAIVSTQVPSRAAFINSDFESRPSAWEKVGIAGNWRFYQDGNAVQGFAIRATTEAVKSLKSAYATEAKRFIFIGHQANLGMLNTVCERTGIAPAYHWYNVDNYGNTGCASAPGVLSMRWNDLNDGDYIAMAIVGAGLSWAHLMLKVEDKS